MTGQNNDDDLDDISGAGASGAGDGNGNDSGQTQQRSREDTSLDDISADLDQQLEDLISGDKNARGKGTSSRDQDTRRGQDQGQGQQRGQQQQRGQDGQGDQSQQRGQSTGGSAQDRPFQSPSRQYGSLFKTDAAGNVIDAAGRVIATAGGQRRVFERTFNSMRGLETEHAAMKTRLEAIESANTAAKAAGLSPEEYAAGIRVMAAWKQDKVKTLNFLLTEATNAGIDVSSIRQGGGVDMAALRTTVQEIIKEAVAPFQPLTAQIEQQQQVEQAREEAQQQLVEFYEEFPQAQIHSQSIAAIMEKTGWNMRESYFALQAHAAKSGWDLTKPLQVQAQAQNGGGQRRTQPTGGGNNSRLPAMNGRGGGRDGTVRAGSRAPATVDTSYDSIISDVLLEHGVET